MKQVRLAQSVAEEIRSLIMRESMKVGDKLVVEFKDATGKVIELHSDGGMLPGTRFAHSIFPDQSNIEVFATPAMLSYLQEHGLLQI